MFLTEDELLIGWIHWSNYQCEIFNFVDLFSEVGIVWSTTTRTWVDDATAVTFFIKCFNPLKLLSSVRKHLQKVVCSILFIYSRAFNKYWSPTVNLSPVTAVLLNVLIISLSTKNI